ncbi:MAG: hypothetical protein K8J31_04710, partial [Anaerolineae bacterium]|nr:hypothetical protein [Anaerolineae bacterium]
GEDALIIRLQESVGRPVTAEIGLEGSPLCTVAFQPYEIKTLKITRQDDQIVWEETNLLEE